MLRTRDVAQDSIGYRGYHRVSSVLGGRTAEIAIFGKNIAIFGKKITFFGKIIAILPTYFAFFGDLHRKILDFTGYRGYQRVSEGFTGFRAPSRPPAIRRRATSSRLWLAGEQSL